MHSSFGVENLTRRIPCPDGPPRSRPSSTLATLLSAAGLLTATLFAPEASAALTRYSSSNNRIYVYGGGNMTLIAKNRCAIRQPHWNRLTCLPRNSRGSSETATCGLVFPSFRSLYSR